MKIVVRHILIAVALTNIHLTGRLHMYTEDIRNFYLYENEMQLKIAVEHDLSLLTGRVTLISIMFFFLIIILIIRRF